MPSRPSVAATAGKNASIELNAICWASPEASSAPNSLPARLRASSHSWADRRCGPDGTCPVGSSVVLVALDKGEAAERRPAVPFAAAPGQQAHGRADPARDDEA